MKPSVEARERYPRVLLGTALAAVHALAPAFAATSDSTALPPPAAAVASEQATGQQSLQDAVASVVVVALTEQFDGRVIAVKIDDYDVDVAGARERIVTGKGNVEVDGDSIGFRYRTIYDVLASNAGYPSISMTGATTGGERSVPNDAMLVAELDERVATQLSKELGDKPVWLQLDRIESHQSAERYLRVNAEGVVDFGIDGTGPARVEGLYDLKSEQWLRVRYELGNGALGSFAGTATGR